MYSTLDGAKKCAKTLKSLLLRSGLSYSLVKCQGAVARAGGYQDWFTLSQALKASVRDVVPFRYWQRLLDELPEPCHPPILRHLGAGGDTEGALVDHWANDTLPYLVAIGMVHSGVTPLLRPGSGEGQQMRQRIMNAWLLNGEGIGGFRPHLEPDTLRVVINGATASTLPAIYGHAHFSPALAALAKAGIIELGPKAIFIAPPASAGAIDEIKRRAIASQAPYKEPIEVTEMDPKTSALFRLQYQLDWEAAGPKAPSDEIDYRGIRLSSRFSVLRELTAMQRVVDAMEDQIRLRVESIWCDSRACAEYVVTITLGMHTPCLAEDIHEIFREVLSGFNGLHIEMGTTSAHFDPYWPEDEEYYAGLEG